jgi:hypothetical protein
MASWALTAALGLLLAAKSAAAPETAADAVTRRDGSVVLGQVVEPSPRGAVTMYVRRAWAEVNLPGLAKRWSDAEQPEQRRARKLRRDRLTNWKRERAAELGQNDPIGDWIERERERLDDQNAEGAEPKKSALMIVKLNRGEIKTMVRRPKTSARMLRQGWLSGFPNVETMKLDDLKSALEGRGFALGSEEPVAIDRLLPIVAEPEPLWLARRAATEVTHDTGLRFLQLNNLLIPEPEPGQPVNLAGAVATLGSVARMQNGPQADSIAEQLRSMAERGRVGAVVTEQKITADLDGVEVTMTLWVRNGDRWTPYGSHTSRVRSADLKRDEANAIANDPQVQTVFQFFSVIGFGPDAQMKQVTLNVGAATRKALGTVRSAFNDSIARLALSIDRRAGEVVNNHFFKTLFQNPRRWMFV